jgi:hypothetical protein
MCSGREPLICASSATSTQHRRRVRAGREAKRRSKRREPESKIHADSSRSPPRFVVQCSVADGVFSDAVMRDRFFSIGSGWALCLMLTFLGVVVVLSL